MDQFQLIRELGRGATGAVYQAQQTDPQREVALKLVHAELSEDHDTHARFHREAEKLAGLDHPGIVRVYEFGVSDGQMFYAMELLRGNDLWEHALDRKRVPPAEVFSALAQAADALAYLHDKALAHREVKPRSLFLESDGRVVLTGFGLSSRGDADRCDDVRRLAFVAHALLTGDMADPPDPAKLEGVPDWFRELQKLALERKSTAHQYRDVLRAKIDVNDRAALIAMAAALPSRLMRVPAMRGLPGTQPLIRSRGDKPLRSGRVKMPTAGTSRGAYGSRRAWPLAGTVVFCSLMVATAVYLLKPDPLPAPPPPPPASPSASIAASVPAPAPSASPVAAPTAAPVPNPVVQFELWPSEHDAVVSFALERPAPCTLALVQQGGPIVSKTLPEARVQRFVFEGLTAETRYTLRIALANGPGGMGGYAFQTASATRAAEVQKPGEDSPPDLRILGAYRAQLAKLSPQDTTTLRRIAYQTGRLADRATADLLEPFVDRIGADAPQVRAALIEALARARHPRAGELARKWIGQSVDPAAIAGCAYALAEAGGPDAAQRILDVLARNPTRVELAPLAARAHRDTALVTFRDWLAANAGQTARAPAAVAGLAQIGEPAVDDLATACRGGATTPTALGALEALAGIAGAKAHAALVEACRAAPTDPRRLWIVGRRGLTELAPQVARAAESGNPALRRDAVCVLALLGVAKLQDKLERALEDADREVAQAAAWGLIGLGDRRPRAVELLKSAIVSPLAPEAHRRIVGDALAAAGPERVLVPISEWQRSGVEAGPGDVLQISIDAVHEPPPGLRPMLALVVGGQATRLRPGSQSVLVTHAGEALVQIASPGERRLANALYRMTVRRGE